MYYLFVLKESDVRAKVIGMTTRPDLLPPESLAGSIQVDAVPSPEPIPKKNAQLYINPQTLEMWFEYTDRVPTSEESMSDMSKELSILKVLIQFIVPKWDKNNFPYERKDIVRLNTGIFQCLIDHSSTAELKPTLSQTYWTKIIDL